MSDILNIGASGVRAYQSALTTVSDNIANAASAGYSRREINLREVSTSGGSITQRTLVGGQGVIVTGATRLADQFRAADVRSASADLARSETGIAWLERIETAYAGFAIGDRLTGFFNAASAVAADPSAITPRTAMLEAGTSVANAFAGTATALSRIVDELDGTAENAVAELSRIAQSLVQVNEGLTRLPAGSTGALQLADQRDLLLERASAISDISVSMNDLGAVTVRLGSGAGPVLMSGDQAGTVTYVRGNDGAVSFAVHRDGITNAVSPNGGVLAGVVDGGVRLANARMTLETLATDFVAAINAVQAQGRDLDGNPGVAMFAQGAQPTSISLALTDPRGVAAAGIGGGPRDNANIVALLAARTSGGFEARMTALVADNGAALAGRRNVAEAQSAIRDSAVATRDAQSGVNLDAEAVDLLRFQQAYQASARVIQVARETLQSLLDIR